MLLKINTKCKISQSSNFDPEKLPQGHQSVRTTFNVQIYLKISTSSNIFHYILRLKILRGPFDFQAWVTSDAPAKFNFAQGMYG